MRLLFLILAASLLTGCGSLSVNDSDVGATTTFTSGETTYTYVCLGCECADDGGCSFHSAIDGPPIPPMASELEWDGPPDSPDLSVCTYHYNGEEFRDEGCIDHLLNPWGIEQ